MIHCSPFPSQGCPLAVPVHHPGPQEGRVSLSLLLMAMTPCMALGDKKILPEGYWGLKHTLDGQKQDYRGPGNWGGGHGLQEAGSLDTSLVLLEELNGEIAAYTHANLYGELQRHGRSQGKRERC